MIFVVAKEMYAMLFAIIIGVTMGTKTKKVKGVTVYKNKAGVEFRVGDTVRLTPGIFKTIDNSPPEYAGRRIVTSRIVSLYPDIPGTVLLMARLGGFWTWDVNDLQKVE